MESNKDALLQSWVEIAKKNGCTHILSVVDTRHDRPADTPVNYPVYAYGLKDLKIVLDHYSEKLQERVVKLIKMNEDGTIDDNYLLAIEEKD